jgi:hypothetical protein
MPVGTDLTALESPLVEMGHSVPIIARVGCVAVIVLDRGVFLNGKPTKFKGLLARKRRRS